MSDGTRPSEAALTSRLRLHRREWRHAGRDYQVISLRPGDPARYAVRRERHFTVVSSDLTGARLLGRLLWGLAYQPRPDTLLVLEPARMVPDHEDGTPSPPVVFTVAPRTVLSPAVARGLRSGALWRIRPAGTVTWNTAGYPAALAARFGGVGAEPYQPDPPGAQLHATDAVLTVAAVPALLRRWAVLVGQAGCHWYSDESCTEPDWVAGFDVHAVRHFHRLVSVARRARAEVLAEPDRPTEPALVAARVRAHIEVVAARRPGPWDVAPSPRPGRVIPGPVP
ncbi:hypothetical protein [Micromonospora auratinigra]|uniref:Uncharacterized protein n=1 Tax=Micromonospora auratinigra TaxID=261654 RepID=A0A1A8Z8K1_9ACTN|nr:hypothetical protein [Micromonospora auratinigra]SBT40124.1 hypothetical protein GA0070611_1141 [Micromonospora auratinigra]